VKATAWLWKIVEYGDGVFPALSALSQFPVTSFTLSSLPSIYRQGLTIPEELRTVDGPNIPEMVIPYVPGKTFHQNPYTG